MAELCNAAGFGFAVLTEAHFAPSQPQRSISDVLRGRWASPMPMTVRDRLLALTHLADFMAACNFARRLKTRSGVTPHEYIAQIWTSEPGRFVNPVHQMRD